MQLIKGLLMPFVLLGLTSLGYALSENDPCTNPAGKLGRCIFFRECEPILNIYRKTIVTPEESIFIDKSRCGKRTDGKPLVCCTGDSGRKQTTSTSLLPKTPFCGASLGERIHGGQPTLLDEYPWTALIEYRKPNGRTGFHCGASLINSRYVVTAAHCIQAIPRSWTVAGVRLGEWDLDQERDCLDGDCADAPLNMSIDKIIVHEDYDPQSKAQYNDIALIRFTRDVIMTSFISPICLPIDNAQRSRNIVGTKGMAAGWGRTENATTSHLKLKVELEFKELKSCSNTYKPSGVILRDTQMCAGGVRGKDTCSGDSGGPLMKQITANNYLYGIVSFGPNKCGTKGVPGVYTNVAKYIDWIESKLE
ncbi:CLIP domain-containing serine protease B4-like [Ochlerotatus camptorhynchus]|uniref:CLIP domain-containing serine protease B4-like n=1 Tax=Ochlerotatus camptorhynchus TaxID=644619 RepID=UPI0031D2AE8A